MNSSESFELDEDDWIEPETPARVPDYTRLIPLVVSTYSVLIIVATIGNLAVVVNLIRLKRLRGRLTGVDKLVLNLAVADLFVAFVTLPYSIVRITTRSWEFGNLLCKMTSFFNVFGFILSGLTVASISLERYLAVASSAVSRQKEERRVKILISVAWITTIIACFPQLLVHHVDELSHDTKDCVSMRSPDENRTFVMTLFVLIHVVPLVAIVTCYSAILVRLRRLKQNAPSNCTAMVKRLRSNVLRMSLAISITFFLCFAPYSIVRLWSHIDYYSMSELLPDTVLFILHTLIFANACLNPIVYGFFQLRKRHERCEENEDENLGDDTVVWSELNLREM